MQQHEKSFWHLVDPKHNFNQAENAGPCKEPQGPTFGKENDDLKYGYSILCGDPPSNYLLAFNYILIIRTIL